MSKPVPAIRSVKARGIVVPLARPVKNAFGVIDVGAAGPDRCRDRSGRYRPLLHLRLHQADAETAGASDRGDRPRTHRQAGRALRPDGGDGRQIPTARLAGTGRHGGVRPRHGLSGTRSARSAGRPVAELLGGSPQPIKAYDSYGVVDPIADEKALRRSLEQGFRGIKIKGGDGDAANDERVVKGGARPDRPRRRADDRLQPVARSRRSERAASPASRPTICTGSRSRCRRKICRATPKCARHRRRRSRPARTGGSRAALPKRSQPAPAISSCPT